MAADALLAPISPNSPAGDDLSEEQQFIQLRQAIRPPSYSKEPDYDAAEQLAAAQARGQIDLALLPGAGS